MVNCSCNHHDRRHGQCDPSCKCEWYRQEPLNVTRKMLDLVLLLHEMGVGCDYKPKDRYDIGMGYDHTGDHDKDARRLISILS